MNGLKKETALSLYCIHDNNNETAQGWDVNWNDVLKIIDQYEWQMFSAFSKLFPIIFQFCFIAMKEKLSVLGNV